MHECECFVCSEEKNILTFVKCIENELYVFVVLNISCIKGSQK